MQRHIRMLAVVLGFLALVGASEAEAQEGLGFKNWGLRGGVTVGPDQGHVGFHVNAGNFAEKVRFQPSVEVGFGSNRYVGVVNLDAFYTFTGRSWLPYLGAGLGVSFTHHDRQEHRYDGVDVDAGLNLVAGFEAGRSNRYLLEARAGVGDIPDFKLTVGINF
jgi:hypothetical protein